MSLRYLLVAFLILAVVGCSNAPLSTEDADVTVSYECASPSGTQVATFYFQSGGGAAGWVYEYVGVRSVNQPFDSREPVLTMTHGYNVRITWHDDTHLTIEYPNTASILRSETEVATASGTVVIAYSPRPSVDGTLTGGPGGCGK